MGKSIGRPCPLCGESVSFLPVHLRGGKCEARDRALAELEERAREVRRGGRS